MISHCASYAGRVINMPAMGACSPQENNMSLINTIRTAFRGISADAPPRLCLTALGVS